MRELKKILRLLLPAAALLLVILAILWQNGVFSPQKDGEAVGTVKLSVRCDRALASPDLKEPIRAVLPEDGVMAEAEVTLYENDTAFSVLERYCRAQKIALSSKGGTRWGVYVEGIGALFEFDCGAQSGWMFSVNGSFLSKSAGDASLTDGDEVLWVYTLDLGKDVGSHAS